MLKLVLPFVFCLLITLPGKAQNNDKRDKIKNLFVVMQQDSLIIKTLEMTATAMVNNMSTLVKNNPEYGDGSADGSKFMERLMEITMRHTRDLSLRMLNKDMVDVYDKYFTSEEIDDLIHFYKSKTGKKMIQQTPLMAKEIMEITGVKYQTELQRAIMKEVEAYTEELRKKKIRNRVRTCPNEHHNKPYTVTLEKSFVINTVEQCFQHIAHDQKRYQIR